VYGRRAAPRASWGRVIIVSSIGAFTGGRRPGSLAYASAKSGLLGLTYALARELGLEGITSSPARFFT
jgi:3-oxoacyl-[acyl-carrier protein] reductase